MHKNLSVLILVSLFVLTGCQDASILPANIKVKINETKPSITKVVVQNDQLIITGSNLDGVTLAKVEGSTTHSFQIESQSENQLVLNAKNALNFLVGATFNLIVSNAQAAATFPISFELQNGQVTATKLHHMGATAGQYLRFNGTNWAPASISSSQIFAGAYDAATDSPDIVSLGGTSGTYYIVTVAGTQDLGSGPEAFSIGDWVIYNGSVWSKIAVGTNTVSNFNGRTGAIVPLADDYSWSMLTKAAGKLTGSKVSEIADVDVAGIQDGDILQWNAGGNKWEVTAVPAPTISAGSITNTQLASGAVDSAKIVDGTIVNADISATAAIDQSKINGLTTALLGKEASLPAGGTAAHYLNGSRAWTNFATSFLGTQLSGYVTGVAGAISPFDTINQALGKLEARDTVISAAQSNYVLLNGTSAMTGNLQMGGHKITGLDEPAANTDAATKQYVDDAITGVGAGSSQWTTTGSNIYYNTGDVGVGTATPGSKLDVAGKIKSSGASAYLEMHDTDTLYTATPQAGLVFRDSGNSQFAFIGPIVNKMQFASWIPIELNVNNNIGVHVATDGNVGIGGTTTSEKLFVSGNAAVEGSLRLKSDNANFVNLRAPTSLAGNLTYTFPGVNGTSGQALTTDGAGNLSWTTLAGGSSPTGSAGGDLSGTYPNPTITGLAAIKVGSGSVDNTELDYLNGVTSNIQSQLDAKQAALPAGGTTLQYFRGDKTLATLDTAVVPENGNQYFTAARVLGTIITTYTSGGSGAIAVTDTVPQALSKLETKTNTLGNYVLRDGTAAMTGDLQMGNHKITGLAAPMTGTDAATKTYVDTALSGVGASQWTSAGSDIHFNTGNVGIGTSTPETKLHIDTTSDYLTLSTTGTDIDGNDADIKFVIKSVSGKDLADQNLQRGGIQFKNESLDNDSNPTIANFSFDGQVGVGVLSPHYNLDVLGTTASNIFLLKGPSSRTISINPPAGLAATYVLNLPTSAGSNNQVLTTDGSGNLSWTTPAGGGAPTGSAGGDLSGTYPNPTISALAATKIGSGLVDNTELDYLNGVTGNLQTQLDAKQANLPSGSTAQYIRGDKTLSTFSTDVQASVMLAFSAVTGAAVIASDTIHMALQKLQGQIDTMGPLITAATSWTKNGTDVEYNNTGNVGIGRTPATKLDVNGGIRPGSETTVTTCGLGIANGEGTQRYNYTTHRMEYCDGGAWVAMNAPKSSYGTLTMLGASNCVWAHNSSTWAKFPVDAQCAAPILGGSALAPTEGKIPAIRFASLPAGEYEVHIHAWAMYAMYTGSSYGQCKFRIWDGTNFSGVTDANEDWGIQVDSLIGRFSYTTDQTDITFYLQARSLVGTPREECRVNISEVGEDKMQIWVNRL